MNCLTQLWTTFWPLWMIEKLREFWKDHHLCIAFKDLKAAFDSVNHRVLWHILAILVVPGRIINLLAKLYDGAESCIWANDKDSYWFPIVAGVRQGCTAVPDLFNCAINYLMLQVSQRTPGVLHSNYQLLYLEYVDDIKLFCESITNLESALNIYQEEATKLGLRVNWSKIKLMHIVDDPDPPPSKWMGRGRICQISQLFWVNYHQYQRPTWRDWQTHISSHGGIECIVKATLAASKYQVSWKDACL